MQSYYVHRRQRATQPDRPSIYPHATERKPKVLLVRNRVGSQSNLEPVLFGQHQHLGSLVVMEVV